MGMSGQLHIPAALYPQEKDPSTHRTRGGVAWTQMPEDKSSAPVRDRTLVVQYVVSQYTDWATPARTHKIRVWIAIHPNNIFRPSIWQTLNCFICSCYVLTDGRRKKSEWECPYCCKTNLGYDLINLECLLHLWVRGTGQRTLSWALRAMRQVGVKARARQCARGNQYQYCVNTSTPTTASMLVWPVRDCRDTVTFRPPVTILGAEWSAGTKHLQTLLQAQFPLIYLNTRRSCQSAHEVINYQGLKKARESELNFIWKWNTSLGDVGTDKYKLLKLINWTELALMITVTNVRPHNFSWSGEQPLTAHGNR